MSEQNEDTRTPEERERAERQVADFIKERNERAAAKPNPLDTPQARWGKLAERDGGDVA